MRRNALALALLASVVPVAGCQWSGDSSITMTSGVSIRCSGLEMHSVGISCKRDDGKPSAMVYWRDVRGYRAGQ